jgi:hypothetical protein
MQSKLTVSNGTASAAGRFPRSFPAALFLLAGLCVSATPLAGKQKRRTVWLALAGVAASGLVLLLSCGGGGTQSPTPGAVSAQPSAKFAVVATSGGIQHSTTVTLVTQ